jgi:hypothetical protein
MVRQLSVSEQSMFVVVRLALAEQALATGFFVCIADATADWFLVTCSHVLDDLAAHANVIVHGPSRGLTMSLTPPPKAASVPTVVADWQRHKDADVAVLRLPSGHPVRSSLGVGAFTPDHFPAQQHLDGLFAIEDVTMVGCPYGYWDSVHGFPIFRRGITASHPAIDHNGKPEGLVDVASFPGSSGSPILVLNEGVIPVKTDARIGVAGNPSGPGMSPGQRLLLLGMLQDAPHYVAAGRLDGVDDDIDIRPVHDQALHLGVYVKARVIDEFIRTIARAA